MDTKQLPDYASFDDYRSVVRIAVLVRWFLLIIWFFLQNYRATFDDPSYVTNNLLALSLSAANAYVSWRVWTGRPISLRHVLGPSLADITLITAGIFTTSGFSNSFFVLYYPALLAMALVLPSRRLSFSVVGLTGLSYVTLSLTTEPGVNFQFQQEKILIMRTASMFAVVGAANLMHRIEREGRRQAVEAERERAGENLALQKKAEEAAQEERSRISRDIHDGIAQSVYALTLGLETSADVAEREDSGIREQLRKLVPLAKKALLESRYYINDPGQILSGEGNVKAIAENQIKEFGTVAGTVTHLSVEGEPHYVPEAVARGFYRILQEALGNVLKHAGATEVNVTLRFEQSRLGLSVLDNGAGFDSNGAKAGHGLGNMRLRADELGGTFDISGASGQGTTIKVTLPMEEVAK